MAVLYNLPDHVKGDTFDPVYFLVKDDGVPRNLDNTQIDIWFRYQNAQGKIALKLTSVADAGIEKTANVGQFGIKEQTIDLPAGRYYYDVQLTEAGVVNTYIYGYITIIQDATQ